MTESGVLNESEMMQRTCKFVRVATADGTVAINREVSNGTIITHEEVGMTRNWDKCEGSKCAHWRWYRQYPWSKVERGGLGYCGIAGKP